MKFKLNYKIKAGLLIVISIAVLFAIGAADGTIPGSEEDPIVTQSYVDQKIEQIKYYIDSISANLTGENAKINEEINKLKTDLAAKTKQIQELENKLKNIPSTGGSAAAKFEVVEMKKGQILIAGDGAEIIPRSGKFTAVYGQKGGLSDITSAKDLKNGEAIVLNHMLIASRSDGRGLKAVTDAFLIIKGTYTVK